MAASAWWILVVVCACGKFCENVEVDSIPLPLSFNLSLDNVVILWFCDHFHSPFVVCFNWSINLFCCFLIILLSGDIQLNPGHDYPCGT